MPYGSHSLQEKEEAPLLTLTNDSKTTLLESLKGKYVVINFWSASDPMSRINNRQLADFTSTLPSSQIRFVSICTDKDITLQTEIMDNDQLPESAITLSAIDVAPEVLDDYQTSSGCRSFLIDPFGNLQKISPSESDITKNLVLTAQEKC